MSTTIDSISSYYQVQQSQSSKAVSAVSASDSYSTQAIANASPDSVVYKTDRVEISDEARQALANAAQAEAASQTTQASQITQANTKAAQATAQPPIAGDMASSTDSTASQLKSLESEDTSETEDSEYTSDLGALTEQQLTDLVSEGKITKTQAQSELSRREALKEQQNASDETSAITDEIQSVRNQYLQIQQGTQPSAEPIFAAMNYVA